MWQFSGLKTLIKDPIPNNKETEGLIFNSEDKKQNISKKKALFSWEQD